MIYPSADKIDKEIESKYALVVLAAKRAKQVKEGARPLINTDSTNPLTIALEEIASGMLKYQFDANSLAGKEALADKEAVVGDRNLDVPHDPLVLPDDLDLVTQAAIELGAEPSELDGDEESEETEEEEADDDDLLETEDEETEDEEE